MRTRIHRLLRQERGQALILFIGIFTVIMLIGAITVDFGLWLSERRGAQTDADLPSLAGAEECARKLAVDSYPADPEGKASDWFTYNDDSGNATPINITGDPTCGDPCVVVNAGHDSRSLFARFFPGHGDAPEISAHARACAGNITGTTRVVPDQVAVTDDPCFDDGQPVFTRFCLIEAGSCSEEGGPGGLVPFEPDGDVAGNNGNGNGNGNNPPGQWTDTPTSTNTPGPSPTPTETPEHGHHGPTPTPTPGGEPCNPHGVLDLEADEPYCSDSGGPPSEEELIWNGAPGNCRVNEGDTCHPDTDGQNGPWFDCVAVQTGNANNILDGFANRLAPCSGGAPPPPCQGPCDTDPNDGVETLEETVNVVVDTGDPATSLYEPRICPGTDPPQISSRIITLIVLDTNPPAGPTGYPIRAFATMYVLGCWDPHDPHDPDHVRPPPTNPAEFDQTCGHGGHWDVYGQFVKLTVTNGDVGTPVPGATPGPGTIFGIALVE